MEINKYVDITKIQEQLVNKSSYAYISMSIEGFFMAVKYFLSRKTNPAKEKISRRRKICSRMNRIFEFKKITNPKLVFTKKEMKSIDNYSKLIDFTGVMVNKALKKEEINNPKAKQDYIFYQILSGMQDRFKTKSIVA